MYSVSLEESDKGGKNWKVTINVGRNKIVTLYFGQKGGETYVNHKSIKKRSEWLKRHAQNDFTVSGIENPRWWDRWLLWNKLSISGAKKDVEQRFGVKFI